MPPTTQGTNTSRGDIKAPRASRRKGVFFREGAHNGEQAKHSHEAVVRRKVGRLLEIGQTSEVPDDIVKGEFDR